MNNDCGSPCICVILSENLGGCGTLTKVDYLLDDIAEYDLSVSNLTPFKNLKLWQERWIESLEKNKCSVNTVISYAFATNTFFDFVKRNRKISIDLIGAKYINRYLLDYQVKLAKDKYEENKLAKHYYNALIKESKQKSIGKNDANFTVLEEFENTLSQRLTVVKMFLKYITENNKDQHDYTRIYDKLAKIKITEKFTDYLTEEELHQVVEYMQIWPAIYKDHKPKSSLRYAHRDAMMMMIYALTGGRSEEIIHVRLNEIEESVRRGEERYVIRISKGKGGKKRTVWLKKSYLEQSVKYMRNELPNSNYYISSTHTKKGYTNRPMSPNAIRTFANMVLNLLGIDKTGLHAFRRGYVTKRIGSDEVDVSIVAKEVGNTIAILEKHYLKHNC